MITLHIVLCIKQVPDTNNVRWSKENNLLREGMVSILNPCDRQAIETALNIKKNFKTHSQGIKNSPAVFRRGNKTGYFCDLRFSVDLWISFTSSTIGITIKASRMEIRYSSAEIAAKSNAFARNGT